MNFNQLSLASITLLLTAVTPVYGASLFFQPMGQQLDDDPINDIETFVGETRQFTTVLDTTGLPAPLMTLEYQIIRDITELDLDNFALPPDDLALFDVSQLEVNIVTEGTEDIADISRTSFPSGVPVDIVLQMETVTYNVLPDLNNDGLSDRRIILTSATDINGNDISSFFDPLANQISTNIEIQPTPEPSTLLGLGLLGVLGFLNKKQAKNDN